MDIGWSRNADEAWTHDAPVEQTDELAMAPFRRFYKRVFRHPASPCLGMARRFVLPTGLTLEVGGLNSSGLKYGQNDLVGMGRLPDGAFDEIRTELGWSDAPSLALRVLVHHHHLSATEDVLPTSEFSRGFGMSVDAKQTLRKAARHGVQLVLHGHRHQPTSARSRSMPSSRPRSRSTTSAGSESLGVEARAPVPFPTTPTSSTYSTFVPEESR